MDEPSISSLVLDFEKSLVRKNRAPATLRAYRYASDEFLSHLSRYAVTTPSALGREHVEGWLDSLSDRGIKPSTRAILATWLRGFLQWASVRTDAIERNLWMSVSQIKVAPNVARPLDPRDVQKILAYFGSMQAPKLVDVRDKALFLTLLTTGLRVSEVLQQRRQDADRLTVIRQKGAKRRTLEIHDKVQEAISDYVKRRTDDHPALWITFRSNIPTGQLAPPGVREVFRKVAERVGVPRFTTHQLRHTTATLLFDEGVSEGLIADYLGHGNIDSVRGYIDIRNRRREAMSAMGRILEVSYPPDRTTPDLTRLASDLETVARLVESGELAAPDRNFAANAGALAAALRHTVPPAQGTDRSAIS